MADYAFFYNSQDGDRKYDADSFSDWLKKFFTTGVFSGDLGVTANDNMTVTLASGYVNINGKVRIFDNSQILTISTADSTYDRIDTIVVERNDTDRNITAKVVTGGLSTSPIPTAPVRANGVYQLVVAQVYVAAGATSITQSVITDKRTDTTVCGLVVCPVDEFDFNQFTIQFDAFFNEFKTNQTSTFATWSAEQKANFEAWVVTIKDILDEETAGHLQLEIDDLDSDVSALKDDITHFVQGGSYIDFALGTDYASLTATATIGDTVYSVALDSNGSGTIKGIAEIGTFTIACGTDSKTLTIADFSRYTITSFVPNGSTVTPTDTIQTWLECASITEKSYTTIDEVLADSTTLLALISSENACKYMARSTTWASSVCANSTAMTDIGNNDTCAELLLADSTWQSAISKSTYYASVLTTKVPTMTNYTLPSGVASASSELYTSSDGLTRNAWKCFGNLNIGGDGDTWLASVSTGWVQYQFTEAVQVSRVYAQNRGESAPRVPKTIVIMGSNDGSSFDTLYTYTNTNTSASGEYSFTFENSKKYKIYRANITLSYDSSFTGFGKLQFYGRA